MEKKPYQKPEIKEVKLIMEDTVLAACRRSRTSTTRSRVSRRACRACRITYARS